MYFAAVDNQIHISCIKGGGKMSTIMKSKYPDENKTCKVEIKIDPMPKNCHECPMYHMPNPENEGTWYEHWDCYLKPIENDYGIAVDRYKDCPL